MKKITTLIILLATVFTANAQNNIGIGTAPNASAKLDVSSTTQGMLVPRMTSIQRNAIATPAIGLMVYQTDGVTGFYYYNGSSWIILKDAANTYPNVELSTSVTSQQTVTGLFSSNNFSTLSYQSNNSNASLTAGNTFNGTAFTVGTGGAGWYEIIANFVGVALGSNGVVTVGSQIVLDKNSSFGTTATAGTYPLAIGTYNSSISSILIKNYCGIQTIVYLNAGDILNIRAQSWSTSTASYSSTEGSTNWMITRIK